MEDTARFCVLPIAHNEQPWIVAMADSVSNGPSIGCRGGPDSHWRLEMPVHFLGQAGRAVSPTGLFRRCCAGATHLACGTATHKKYHHNSERPLSIQQSARTTVEPSQPSLSTHQDALTTPQDGRDLLPSRFPLDRTDPHVCVCTPGVQRARRGLLCIDISHPLTRRLAPSVQMPGS